MNDAVVRDTLDNGLTLVTESIPHLRSVAIGVWVKRGSRHETPAESGLSHFIEHMVFKGTAKRSAEQIASEVDSIGGNMDAFTSKEYAAFDLKVLDEHLPHAVEILADIVRNPLFDADELTKEKKVIFEEIHMVEDTPDDLVMELFAEAFWPDHPLGRPVLGTAQTVESFDRDALAGYFRSVYHPGNVLIAAAGRMEHAVVADLVHEGFGDLARGTAGAATEPPRAVPAVVARSKRELEQVHLCVGRPAPPQDHPDRYAAYVLNTMLGGSMSSRLFQNVREKRGLVYSISSGLTSYSDAGHVTVYAGMSLESIDEVVRLIVEEMRRLRDEEVGAVELRRAQDHLKGNLLLSLESSGSRMSYLARQEICFGRPVPIDEVTAGIDAVTAADVRRVAGGLFDGALAASLVGNLGDYQLDPASLRL